MSVARAANTSCGHPQLRKASNLAQAARWSQRVSRGRRHQQVCSDTGKRHNNRGRKERELGAGRRTGERAAAERPGLGKQEGPGSSVKLRQARKAAARVAGVDGPSRLPARRSRGGFGRPFQSADGKKRARKINKTECAC